MSNLKQLRTRIKTVQSTQKITAAMKMVAAAKLRRSQEQAEGARPFADEVRALIERVLYFGDVESKPMIATGNNAATLLILFAADRGLCGGFNANMFRLFRKKAQSLLSTKQPFYCIGIGNKARSFLSYNYSRQQLDDIQPTGLFGFDEALQLSTQITDLVNRQRIGRVEILYTQFKSVILLLPHMRTLVPLSGDMGNETVFQNDDRPVFEPSEEGMFEGLLQLFMSTELYSARLQSSASEQAARMTAMDSATRNAQEMASNLKLKYNRTRQSMITKELIEIISGAQSTH
ncbi:MAG: ATP synthase gamma chain [Holosporales bacterium]